MSKEEKSNVQDSKTSQEEKKSENPAVWIIGGILLIILIIWLLVAISEGPAQEPIVDRLADVPNEPETDTQYTYKEFAFVKGEDNLWYTQLRNRITAKEYLIPFHYGPKEVDTIAIEGNIGQFFQRTLNNNISIFESQAYVTFDPHEENQDQTAIAGGELALIAASVYDMHLETACAREHPDCEKLERPVVTCESTDQPVISFEQGLGPRVVVVDNCLRVIGEEWDIVKSTDRVLYKMLEIID